MLGVLAELMREQFLGNQWQACLAREHQAKDEEGERFGAMPMHVWEELAQLGGPLAPEVQRCFHKESVPFHEVLSLLSSW